LISAVEILELPLLMQYNLWSSTNFFYTVIVIGSSILLKGASPVIAIRVDWKGAAAIDLIIGGVF